MMSELVRDLDGKAEFEVNDLKDAHASLVLFVMRDL